MRVEGRGTLDDVMRHLWSASSGGPIDEGDIAAALEAVGGRSYARELADWVHGTGELPLATLLERVGVEIESQPATMAQRLGVRVSESALTGVKVTHVLSDSAAERAGLSPGDEIIAAGGWRVRRLDDAARAAGRRGSDDAAREPGPARGRDRLGHECSRVAGGRRPAQDGRRGDERRAPAVRGMDRRLSEPAAAARPSRGRRRLAWLGVVAVVVLLHGAVTRELATRMSEFDLAHAMPARIAVSYVRTIEPTAPPPVAANVAPPAAKRARRAPKRVAPAASAPQVAAVEPAASETVVAAAEQGDRPTHGAGADASARLRVHPSLPRPRRHRSRRPRTSGATRRSRSNGRRPPASATA